MNKFVAKRKTKRLDTSNEACRKIVKDPTRQFGRDIYEDGTFSCKFAVILANMDCKFALFLQIRYFTTIHLRKLFNFAFESLRNDFAVCVNACHLYQHFPGEFVNGDLKFFVLVLPKVKNQSMNGA